MTFGGNNRESVKCVNVLTTLQNKIILRIAIIEGNAWVITTRISWLSVKYIKKIPNPVFLDDVQEYSSINGSLSIEFNFVLAHSRWKFWVIIENSTKDEFFATLHLFSMKWQKINFFYNLENILKRFTTFSVNKKLIFVDMFSVSFGSLFIHSVLYLRINSI